MTNSAPVERRPLLVGLTGGIACGKSTVAGMFREAGVPVLDADEIVHELLAAEGAAVEAIAQSFGDDVLTIDHAVDRAKLAEVVFDDEGARKKLEQIVHPLVHQISQQRLDELAENSDVVLYEAALLVETSRHEDFNRLIVVFAQPEVQLERLMNRDSITSDQAGARLRAQMPVDEKAKHADYLIDNSGHWEATRQTVTDVIDRLREDFELLNRGESLPIRDVVPQ